MYEFDISNMSDEQVLEMYREGNDVRGELTAELISRYIGLIKIKARKSRKSAAIDADDLISEGFLGLLSAIRTFSKDKGAFSAYANVCIANRIKNASRGLKNPEYDDGFDISETPDKLLTEEFVLEKESEREIALRLSGTLSDFEFKVFSLYLNSHSYKAIADRLSVSEKSVDNALSRARGKLRKIYNK